MIKKIIIFIPAIEKGGVERNAIWAANEFIKRGLEVDVAYVRIEEEQNGKFCNEIRHVVFPRKKIPGLNQRLSDAISIRKEFDKYLKTQNAAETIVLAFQSASVAISICRKNGIKVICRLSNHPSAVKYEKSAMRKLSEWLKPHTYKKADVIIANSDRLAEDFGKLVGREVLTVYNPIDFAKIEREKQEPVLEELRKEAEHFQGKMIVSVGRLRTQKDPVTLIKGFALSKHAKELKLWLIGEGDKRAEVEQLISEYHLEENVRLLGYQKNVYKYLKYADLFVQTSLYEGCPNSLIEAVAAGIPAIATNCLSGPAEVLANGQGGELIPLENPEALAQKIDEYLENSEVFRRKALVAKEALTRYENENVINKYIAIFKQLSEV